MSSLSNRRPSKDLLRTTERGNADKAKGASATRSSNMTSRRTREQGENK